MFPLGFRLREVDIQADAHWLVSFMNEGLGYFDDETCRLERLQNRFGPKVVTFVSGMIRNPCVWNRPMVIGEPRWNRTIDPLIKSQMLYR